MYGTMSSNQTTIGAYYSLEHKERYDTTISGEWYIFVLQQLHRDFLLCHLVGASLDFTLCFTFVVLVCHNILTRRRELAVKPNLEC